MASNATNPEEAAQAALERLRQFLSPHAGVMPEEPGEIPQPTTESVIDDDDNEQFHDVSEENNYESIPPPPPPRSNEVATVRSLSPISREFLRVSYLLQASLPGYQVLRDQVMIYDMRNPSVVSQYEQYTSGYLELDSWVAVSALGPENCMSDVYSSGFTSPTAANTRHNSGSTAGMKFSTGNIMLTENMTSKKATGHCQYVLCKIAVGKSYVVDSESEASVPVPKGYNSFYVNNTTATTSGGYYHEYIINNNLQILPQYLVQFSYKNLASSAADIANMKCDLCERKTATVICKSCEGAKLCSSCDTEVHSANKLVSRHKRVKITAATVSSLSSKKDLSNGDDATCSKHKGINVEFYCPTCATPVCVHCKMVGDHSCGPNAEHRLVSISDAYNTGLEESTRPDPLIDARTSVITSKLSELKTRSEEVKANAADVEAAIKAAAADALASLASETTAKLKVLSGEELELKRQVAHVTWAEGFLCQERRVLPPVEFLNAWNHHKVLRAELRDFPVMHLPSAEIVKPDIQLIGGLHVVTGENGANVPLNTTAITPVKKVEKNNQLESVMSPKSTELITKVKKELAKGASRTMKNSAHVKKSAYLRRPSASGIDGIYNQRPSKVSSPLSANNHRQKNDPWTQKIRQEMQKQPVTSNNNS